MSIPALKTSLNEQSSIILKAKQSEETELQPFFTSITTSLDYIKEADHDLSFRVFSVYDKITSDLVAIESLLSQHTPSMEDVLENEEVSEERAPEVEANEATPWVDIDNSINTAFKTYKLAISHFLETEKATIAGLRHGPLFRIGDFLQSLTLQSDFTQETVLPFSSLLSFENGAYVLKSHTTLAEDERLISDIDRIRLFISSLSDEQIQSLKDRRPDFLPKLQFLCVTLVHNFVSTRTTGVQHNYNRLFSSLFALDSCLHDKREHIVGQGNWQQGTRLIRSQVISRLRQDERYQFLSIDPSVLTFHYEHRAVYNTIEAALSSRQDTVTHLSDNLSRGWEILGAEVSPNTKLAVLYNQEKHAFIVTALDKTGTSSQLFGSSEPSSRGFSVYTPYVQPIQDLSLEWKTQRIEILTKLVEKQDTEADISFFGFGKYGPALQLQKCFFEQDLVAPESAPEGSGLEETFTLPKLFFLGLGTPTFLDPSQGMGNRSALHNASTDNDLRLVEQNDRWTENMQGMIGTVLGQHNFIYPGRTLRFTNRSQFRSSIGDFFTFSSSLKFYLLQTAQTLEDAQGFSAFGNRERTMHDPSI